MRLCYLSHMQAAKAQTSLRIRALTAHIHNEGACRGCEFEISKAIEMIGTSGIRFIYHTPVEVCTPTLLHAKTSLRVCTAQSYQHLCF